jgi:hypothetical protein
MLIRHLSFALNMRRAWWPFRRSSTDHRRSHKRSPASHTLLPPFFSFCYNETTAYTVVLCAVVIASGEPYLPPIVVMTVSPVHRDSLIWARLMLFKVRPNCSSLSSKATLSCCLCFEPSCFIRVKVKAEALFSEVVLLCFVQGTADHHMHSTPGAAPQQYTEDLSQPTSEVISGERRSCFHQQWRRPYSDRRGKLGQSAFWRSPNSCCGPWRNR